MTVRGAKADITRDGVLNFEQSPQIITIGVQLAPYDAAQKANTVANAVLVANALVPANQLASSAASAAASVGSPSDTLLTATLGATTVTCP